MRLISFRAPRHPHHASETTRSTRRCCTARSTRPPRMRLGASSRAARRRRLRRLLDLDIDVVGRDGALRAPRRRVARPVAWIVAGRAVGAPRSRSVAVGMSLGLPRLPTRCQRSQRGRRRARGGLVLPAWTRLRRPAPRARCQSTRRCSSAPRRRGFVSYEPVGPAGRPHASPSHESTRDD